MPDRQLHSNTNFRSAKPMNTGQICVVACSWVVHYQIIAAFVGPTSPGMMTVAWSLAWGFGVMMALVVGGFYADYSKAVKHGPGSEQYAALMTGQPLPPIPVTAVTAFMLILVSFTASDAGFYVLVLLYMALAIAGMGISALRRAYHARIGL